MIANSGFSDAILLKHMPQPCAASSSGSMCVSVKKTKSNDPGAGALSAGKYGSAMAAPAVAIVVRNFLRSRVILLLSFGIALPSLMVARQSGPGRGTLARFSETRWTLEAKDFRF